MHWTRLNLRYRPAVTIARAILRYGAIDIDGDSAASAPAFMVDMNQVFEDVVGQGIQHALNPDHAVDLQRANYLDAQRRVQIRPDIVIRSGGRVIAVADVKYKQSLASDDVFQAVAYATRYGLTECTLIYPEKPPVDRLQIRDVTVRLAAIEIALPKVERTAALHRLAHRLSHVDVAA